MLKFEQHYSKRWYPRPEDEEKCPGLKVIYKNGKKHKPTWLDIGK